MRWLVALALVLSAAVARAGVEACGAAPCTVDGGSYVAVLPQGQARGGVLFLHGHTGTGPAVLLDTALVAAVTARGYALIAPTGMPLQQGSDAASWNARANPAGRDDVAFLRRVADDAAARFALPRDRMVASGFSVGGMMVWQAACRDPGAFAAYAPVAGLFWRPFPERCAGPVRLLHTHGWIDPTVPLEGRSFRGGTFEQGDLFAGLEFLRQVLGCATNAPDAYATRGSYMIRAWNRCAPGASLTFALHPGGHGVPPDWASLALDWFEDDAP